MPAYQDFCQEQEPQNQSLSSSMENSTSAEENESLPGSLSSPTSLFVIGNNHESSSNNDKSFTVAIMTSCPVTPWLIWLIMHDDGISTTPPKTSEELSQTLSSLDQSSSTERSDYNESLPHIKSSSPNSSFTISTPFPFNESTASDHLYSSGDKDKLFTSTMNEKGKLNDNTFQSLLQTLVFTLQWTLSQRCPQFKNIY